jgi:hypothetical protein
VLAAVNDALARGAALVVPVEQSDGARAAAAEAAAPPPLAAVDVGYQIPCRHTDDSLVLPPVTCPLPVDLLYVNADQTLATRQSLLAQGHTEGRYTIGFWHWEQPQIPRRHHAAFSELDEVWVPSTFVQDAVAAVSPVPVFKVPHAVKVTPSARASRDRFGLPGDRQLVLVMYDFNSFQDRKNPQAAIAAYRIAAARSPALGLVVKTHNGAANPEALADYYRRTTAMPTFDVNAITCRDAGQNRTIVPCEATAAVSFRLVGGQVEQERRRRRVLRAPAAGPGRARPL